MKLTALRLHNVKRFAGRGIAVEGITDGVNVLSAANEHGKSTCFEALHALFFQPHSGTPKNVQMLRPYSGGNPIVEADISIETGRYRLTKQFYSGRRASVTDLGSGRIVAQADEAEAFIGDLISGGTSGPAGLLWVRQGVTGIENRSKSEEENDKRVRESLLSSVQGEVEALTGGRRMTAVLEACEEELNRLVTTTLRPKTGGRFAAALEERDRLQAEEARLAKEVEMLHGALDRRRSVQARLRELENSDEEAGRKAAIANAEAVLEAAKLHERELKALDAEAALAASRRDAAQQAFDRFHTALNRSGELARRFALAEKELSNAAEQRTASLVESEAATAEVQAAEAEERVNREWLARLEAALRSRHAAERLAELRQRLEQAETARQQIEDGEAAHALLAIPADAIERLEALDLKIVGLRAAAEVGLPTLRIDYLKDVSGLVSMDRQPLPGGEDKSFAGMARLDIAGVGTLTIHSSRQAEQDGALETAQSARQTLLAKLGVESLLAARQRDIAARSKHEELVRARQRLADLAPKGIDALHLDAARFAELSQGPVDLDADPEEVRTRLADATRRIELARNRAREASVMRTEAGEAILRAQTEHARLRQELDAIEAIIGPEAGRNDVQQDLTAELSSAKEQFDAAELRAGPLRRTGRDLAGAEAALARARSVADAAGREIARLREELADLGGQIRTRSDSAVEENWSEIRDLLAAAREQVKRFETEVAVLDRLRKALTATRAAARDLYLKPVMNELAPLVGLLFDDISITFDGDSLLPQIVRRNGLDEDVDRLSGGMREQLSVLTRLAFARLLTRDGRPAPVILDDALVYSDDDRIERMFDALHRQSRDQQILVFSCRQRAFARLGGNVLAMQPWQPD
ncbi:AAA family ATPase [Rhizobium chutanense]|uniref:DNA-binding protein n=1 Tax=Rhizobium chutanense TaxID=2035448 RepID=A0A432P7K7_9HYPH|nr:AAA family ATPase [Rhizobium chutanense]RUM08684.1 DNA-binding protein [Rhizobium chutanense]